MISTRTAAPGLTGIGEPVERAANGAAHRAGQGRNRHRRPWWKRCCGDLTASVYARLIATREAELPFPTDMTLGLRMSAPPVRVCELGKIDRD
jgi:hypothetical protein